ncbi:MAG TPA: phosphate uptake regulator PhoU [Nitrosopumilaceae archaeon]|nr:phosphate uptake regulator PhoU [Nitrosopumilaceae archaeon]
MTKFIRRLQKIGSSILVSLPKEWVDANKLDKSSQVELETGQASLSISINKDQRPSKDVAISYPLPKDENIVADITGAYLLGYDIIRIEGKKSIPIEDREKIRNSMRNLVGMEIIDEDATHVNMQFLLDETTLQPEKILKRMSSLSLGMFNDVVDGLISDDKSNLLTLSNRDIEVNRQYFLLVRLIRSTMIDVRLAGAFSLENIDILDYRVAANILENAGDIVVELGSLIANSSISYNDLKQLYEIVKNFEPIAIVSTDAFTQNNRTLAIQAISQHKKFQEKMLKFRTSLEKKKTMPIDYLDLINMFERVTKSWDDLVDLVKPIYKK